MNLRRRIAELESLAPRSLSPAARQLKETLGKELEAMSIEQLTAIIESAPAPQSDLSHLPEDELYELMAREGDCNEVGHDRPPTERVRGAHAHVKPGSSAS
jgi:hypothetical protein